MQCCRKRREVGETDGPARELGHIALYGGFHATNGWVSSGGVSLAVALARAGWGGMALVWFGRLIEPTDHGGRLGAGVAD